MTDERLRALNPYRPETSEHHAWAHGLATALAATPDWKVAKAECEAKTDPDNFARNLAATPETPTLNVERVVEQMENEGVVTWGDEGHRDRFLALFDD